MPTCLYGRLSSSKTHVVRLVSSTEVDVVIAALPSTASAGAQPPLKTPFHSSTLNSERTILIDPCSRHGKYACVAGVSAPPPEAAKVMTDVTEQVMAADVALTFEYTARHSQE